MLSLMQASASALPLDDGTVQCVVTSPPYWGLRDYKDVNQLGLEETPEAYVAHLVEAFREVRRVLRTDGTCWLNLGDTYAGSRDAVNLKPKDLVGIPWRVALALQADGWWLRSDIIWSKPNPMPENIRDRPTKAHEYLFLLAKAERYYYDYEAISETAIHAGETVPLGEKSLSRGQAAGANIAPSGNGRAKSVLVPERRNRRSVWEIGTQNYPGTHYATFPEKLVEPCILAGSRPGDVVLDPFAGSGTTGRVAIRLGRRAVLSDVSREYLRDHAVKRTQTTIGLPLQSGHETRVRNASH